MRSPEQLDDYIRVSNPSVWLILAALVLLLVGLTVWACVGTVYERVPGALVVRDGQAICYVDQGRAADIAPGDPIRTVKKEKNAGIILSVSEKPVSTLKLVQHVGDALIKDTFKDSVWALELPATVALPEGNYDVEVITAEYRPISLLFGNPQ
ncbi:MAG: hypothetical protein Q4D06_09795 [Coriobacteriia bacterium]|nr:hypothetical protein [Coriobacteriia bacterium]